MVEISILRCFRALNRQIYYGAVQIFDDLPPHGPAGAGSPLLRFLRIG
jgi:hypothetical protein